MRSFQEIFDEIIPPTEKFSLFGYIEIEEKCRLISERYAEQLLIDIKERCADNAYAELEQVWDRDFMPVINKESILSTEILLP